MKKNEVRIVPLDWDKECEADLYSGNGFRITQPAIKGTTKLPNGIQSEKFGTDFDSEDGFAELYRCEKGCTQGKVFEGSNCPVCGGKVTYRDVNMSITGWMILDKHTIIQPIFYHKLANIIGAKILMSIITFDKRVSKNGDLEHKESDKTPFYGIGLMEFYNRFDEILEYYANKKKGKEMEVEEIIENRDKIFTHCIPVYSAILRPMSFRGESMFYCTIDKLYNKIYTSISLLNNVELYEKRRKKWTKEKRERMDHGTILSDIQLTLLVLWDNIFEQVDQKTGHIQGDILGGMLNFSSRDVIIPDPSLKADEIRLNYMATLELFKFEIIAYLCEMNNILPNDAYEQWAKARIVYNEKIYEIMKYMIKSHTRWVIINRNPTINYGSLLCVKIKSVKSDFKENYTMSMPLQILNPMNADFDGDILNVVSLKSDDLAKAFNRTFNPKFNLFISRNNGLFNNEMNLFKDQLIGLYEFNNI